MKEKDTSSELKSVLMSMIDASYDGFTYTDRDGRFSIPTRLSPADRVEQ